MSSSVNTRVARWTLGFAIAAVLLSVLLMALRGYGAISLAEPLQAATRGCEYESSYVFWKYVAGLPVFVDPTRIPFAGTYYNWLYYAFYGEIIRFALQFLSLSDAWLPTLSKLITFAGVLAGAVITTVAFARLVARDDPWLKAFGAALAGYLFLGPLMGFWGISNAPDVWALVLDVAAVFLFLELYARRPRAAIFAFAALAYCAWGFKQTFVYGTGTVGLFLLWRRDWRGVALLAAAMSVLWVATLLTGGLTYQKSILAFGGTKVKLQAYDFFRNFGIFLSKSMPLLAGLFLLPTLWRDRQRILHTDPILVFAAIGTALSFALTLPTSAKQGAGDNYYFIPAFYLSFLLLAALARLKRNGAMPAGPLAAVAVGWIVSILGVGSVLLGLNGVLSVRKSHDSLMAANRAIGALQQPSFIALPYLELPWMRPKTQHFVLHCSYFWDREANVSMERNGVGGLIAEGFFASLVLPRDKTTFDGASLDGYRLAREDLPMGLALYLRKTQ